MSTESKEEKNGGLEKEKGKLTTQHMHGQGHDVYQLCNVCYKIINCIKAIPYCYSLYNIEAINTEKVLTSTHTDQV